IWAPRESVWSPFAKPVLFSYMTGSQASESAELNKEWDMRCDQDTVLFVDAPGPEGVSIGLCAAASGYRPIPLYNACPFAYEDPDPHTIPSILSVPSRQPSSAPSAVDVVPIMTSLLRGTDALSHFDLRASAPAAFLLDEHRRGATS